MAKLSGEVHCSWVYIYLTSKIMTVGCYYKLTLLFEVRTLTYKMVHFLFPSAKIFDLLLNLCSPLVEHYCFSGLDNFPFSFL